MSLPIRNSYGKTGWALPRCSRIIAVDPGKRTGIAVFDQFEFESYESSIQQEVCNYIFGECAYGWVDAVVCENFIISGQTGKKSRQPYSLELIGVIRFICERYGVEFILQQPTERKAMTDAYLKKLDWYKGSKGDYEGHADDAARHLGTYLMNQQDQEFLRRIYQ